MSNLGGVPLLLGVGVAGVACCVNPAAAAAAAAEDDDVGADAAPMEEEEEWPGDPEPEDGVAGVKVV